MEGVLSGQSANQARIAAGYSSSSASTRLMADERVREEIKLATLKAGGTFAKAAEKLIALWDAEQYGLTRDGERTYIGPDNRSQVQAVELYLKMMGAMPNPRLEIDQSTQNVLVIDSARSPLAALDPFSGTVVEPESVQELPSYNPDGGIPPEDDFQIG